MEDSVKKIVLEYINQPDNLDILDPDGICTFVKFQDIIIKDNRIRFDFLHNPNSEEFEEILSYKMKTNEIIDSEGYVSRYFLDDLYKYFSEFMIERYRDNW